MLLDTSGLLCLEDASDPRHAMTVEYFVAADRRVTHNYVVAEFTALAVARRRPQRKAVAFLDRLYANPSVAFVHVEPPLHDAGMQVLRQRLDKKWTLCDVISFLLMDNLNVREALTTDHHFEQAGFVRLLPH